MVTATATRKKTASTAPKKIEKVTSSASMDTLSTGADDKAARKHLTSVLGIHISQARCEKYLKSIINDPADVIEHKRLKAYLAQNPHKEAVRDIHKEIMGLRKKENDTNLLPAERNTFGKQAENRLKGLKEDVRNAYDAYVAQQEVVKRIIRLSKDVPVAVATVGDFIVKDLITFAMDFVLTNTKNRTVEIKHLFQPGFEDTQVYPIVRTLKTFEKYAKNPELHKKVKATDDAPVEEDAASTDSDAETVNFVRYIHNLIRNDIRSNERYRQIRVGAAMKVFMSELIVDILDYVSVLAKIVVHDLTHVSTLKSEHFVNIVKIMVAPGGRKFAVFEDINKNIHDKIDLYHQHSKPKKAEIVN